MTEFQVSFWMLAPLFTSPAASSPLPFSSRKEEMVKDYTVAAGTSKGGSAAKGKDNVLAALIGVCGCHILITSLKKERGEERKKGKKSHYTTVQGMQRDFL